MKKVLIITCVLCAAIFRPTMLPAQMPPPNVPGPPPGTSVHVLPALNLSDLEKALSTTPLTFSVKAASKMPSYDPIAHYMPQGSDPIFSEAAVWVNADYAGLLDPLKSMPLAARKALLSAAILSAADSGAAGDAFKAQYMLSVQFDASCTGCTDKYSARHMFADSMADQLLADGFVLKPKLTGVAERGGPSMDSLLAAVLRELSPGVAGVDAVRKTAAEMPPWDQLAHYVGIGVDKMYKSDEAVVYVNSDHVAAHGNSVASDPELLHPYLEAFIMATCDLGHAGPAWKKLYDKAAAADSLLAETVLDRYANRRALVEPLALQLLSRLQAR